ncbi:serine/threonine protein kinase [Actinosynnema pretiosum subsp. pretiosum]|uniref:non-specific serine/threonine protein kinase n=1 Tax=Actinosynnema pretiosum subsp. pretiosum TaxID=103721 RepID=A0AA45L945_9PSEU|nr:serine/threonine protein kinase [Actinosynnema pretiosum subsp. pretiosum]
MIRLLGRGGMGEVHIAEDTSRDDRKVAIKLIPTDVLRDPDLEERFRRECALAARIDHPNVLPVYDYSVGARPYIVMRYVEGTDLATEVAHGPLSPQRAVSVVEQVAAALDAAHRKALRHRDVKPSNVLLEQGARRGTDHAWLFDWGIAQPITAPPITRLGQVVGTPHYIAPERLETSGSDHRADVYSLAVVLYECLAGRRPFDGDEVQVLMGHLKGEVPQLPPHVPPAMQKVVERGLAKHPADRYQSAGELAAAAHEALDEELPAPAPAPAPEPEPAPEPSRPRSPWTTPVVTGVLAGGVSLVATPFFLDPPLWSHPALAIAVALLTYAVTGNSPPPTPPEPTTKGPNPGDETRDVGSGGFPSPRP